MVQFRILRNARGNALRLDVTFDHEKPVYLFNDYFLSYSSDGRSWQPLAWESRKVKKATGKSGARARTDTLLFPVLGEDTLVVGHQVPLSYDDLTSHVRALSQSPFVRKHVVGRSLEGRELVRLEVTDPESPHPRAQRWVHYFANQHPGEHNSQWRMLGMLRWLVSDEAADFRRRNIAHFILISSPDAPGHGWYRVNAQGVDMNRSFVLTGADAAAQPHESYLLERDLETLMASEAPVTAVWSMHTWGGLVEPLVNPGPDLREGSPAGSWTALRDEIERFDRRDLIKPLKLDERVPVTSGPNGHTWSVGPHRRWGITGILCEGGGSIFTESDNRESGESLIRGIAATYRGLRPSAGVSKK
jgi:hypothetical protein